MITDDPFPVLPWEIRETSLDVDLLAQSESLFALSNGHIGVRGNLDEGDPSALPGTYLNSLYETRPLPYAEAGYGYPESGQTIVNVTNGKLIRLLVDDEPFDLRYGQIRSHERVLDLKRALLHRVTEWESPSGRTVRVTSTRLVSLSQRAILAIRYQVEAVDLPVRVVVQSELVANEELPKQSNDPRVAAALESPLQAVHHGSNGLRSSLIHCTRVSELRMAAAADHVLEGVDAGQAHTYVEPDWSRTSIGTRLKPGETLTVTKYVAYGWSSQRSVPALRDQVDAALSSVVHTGWDGLVAEQEEYAAEFWSGADVEVEGDDSIQQAVRFGLFHVLQSGARAEQRGIPAKGLTGPGYDGHCFWDTEMFVLPVLTATWPGAAADALRWRHSTLDRALQRAETLDLQGAAFPWRTIRGEECSAYWPAGTAAFHVNAGIAAAAMRYVHWSGDEDFARTCALPLHVHTARLWDTLGYVGADGEFHIDGVTGPDEYSAIVDDNVYTNLMAAANLRHAAELAAAYPDEAAELEVTDEEKERWRSRASVVSIPREPEHSMPEQHRGATRGERWNFERTASEDRYPLLLHSPYVEIYRKQVVKQADLMLAMHWQGDAFTAEEKAAAFAYYEELTVRDSSLSACTQAVIAAEVGQLDLAYAYLTEAALMDLHDLEHNTRDGVHVASLAGAWIALVCGFGGMRDHEGHLSFAPRLPERLSRLHFSVRWRGARLHVDVGKTSASYVVEDGADAEIELRHYDDTVTVGLRPVEVAIPPLGPVGPRPTQPAGRAPTEPD